MLTYKANSAGSLFAAHSGTCRVGYVDRRKFNRWFWQLSLVQPGGGYGVGFEDDEASAKEALEASFAYWIACAKLVVDTGGLVDTGLEPADLSKLKRIKNK